MKDVFWFRLAVRAIGLLLIGLGLPSLTHAISSLISVLAETINSAVHWDAREIASWAGWLGGQAFQCVFGAYLLLGGDRLIRFCTRDALGRCARCGYTLEGVVADRCPECGTEIRERMPPRSGPADPPAPQSRHDGAGSGAP